MASHAWAHDHNDAFPMQVPMNQGGTLEFADQTRLNPDFSFTFRHFQSLSNELIVAKVLVCPADRERVAVNSFDSLRNENVSYWINPAARFGHTDSPLAGDRNVRMSGRMEWAFLQVSANDSLQFSAALHGYRGNVLFGDAHVADLESVALRAAFNLSSGVVIALPQRDVEDGNPFPGTFPGNGAASTASSGSRGNANPTGTSSPNDRSVATSTPETLKRGRDATTYEGTIENFVVFTRLDGTFATSTVPRRATNFAADQNRVEPPKGNVVDAIMEFIAWLTHKAAGGTYWLLLLLLLALIGFEFV
ncbi:MAG TPA: hypothetical protein VK846_01425, partial [Candidatus Limnocylindria bacterium]|nr:hypothetical protein [Candidatus Limnocylindria bacterium]